MVESCIALQLVWRSGLSSVDLCAIDGFPNDRTLVLTYHQHTLRLGVSCDITLVPIIFGSH